MCFLHKGQRYFRFCLIHFVGCRGGLPGQNVRKYKQNEAEIFEASEILEMFEILPDSFCWLPWWPSWPKCKEIQAKMSVRSVVEIIEATEIAEIF